MELSTPHSDPPLLLGLAIFQCLHKLEYVRTIHMFKKRGYIHMIQQEFLSEGWSLKEMSAPTHLACLSTESHVKVYMDMVRVKQETESWNCLLDFCTYPARNHSSQTTQSLALDMLVTNAWAKANALFMDANNAHESRAINWEQPHAILPSFSAWLQGHKATEHEDHHMGMESPDTMSQRLQFDLWQQWGSDLELASPKIFELPLLRNTGLHGATSSPTLSNNNVDPWTHKLSMPTPHMLLNVMEEPQFNGEIQRNLTGFACTLVPANSQFESTFGESSTSCNLFGTMPFDCGVTQPMSSTSNTYSSSDERGLDAVNSGAPDQLKDEWGGSDGFSKAKESVKFHKSSSARAASGRVTELTKDELTHYFNMPITQASKELKVGLTVLKKRCRIFGIPRWPHRKMKSINSLITNVQDLAKGDGDNDSDASHVQVAVEDLEKQKKEMQESPGTQLAERTKRLRQACFKATYRKRRQEALNGLSIDDHRNAAWNSSNSNSSNNSSSSNSFYHYCE